MENTSKNVELRQTLGFWDLMSASIGQIIGAGIMSLTGVAIAMTGRSVPVAFIGAAIMVLITYMPLALVNTVGRFGGGQYSIIGTMLSKKLTGAYIIMFILQNLSLSMYCLSFADYALPFLPMFPRRALAMGILVLIYGLNIFGIDKFSKFQNFIVAALVLALAIFSIYGMLNLEWQNYYDPSTFLTDGMLGLFTAMAQLTFATGGANVISNLSAEAKDPSRDIPKAMIVSTVSVAILYAFMSVTAAGILPVEKVANQPLTYVAETILPTPLYVFFIIGGAWAALISTLNSQLATCTKPLIQAAKDGWIPRTIGELHRKYKTPVYLLTFFLIVGLIPIALNIDISVISKTVTFVGTAINAMLVLSFFKMTRNNRYRNQWEESPLHLGKGAATVLTVVSLIIFALQAYLMGRSLPVTMLVLNAVVITVAIIFANIKYSTGKVDVTTSFIPNELRHK